MKLNAWLVIAIFAIFTSLLFWQVQNVSALSQNPITSPITSPVVTPTPSPTPTTPPITAPLVTPTPVATPTPVPTPIPTPIATSTPTPVSTPTPLPTPVPTPTPTATPAPLGYNRIGSTLDTGDSNFINGSRFMTGSQAGAIHSMSVYVKNVDSAPHNQFQLAIYTANGGNPDKLVAKTQSGSLKANSWNTLPITATLQPNTKYFLFFNTNGRNNKVNNMTMDVGNRSFYGVYSSNPIKFGLWPQNFNNISVQTGNWNWSLYASF